MNSEIQQSAKTVRTVGNRARSRGARSGYSMIDAVVTLCLIALGIALALPAIQAAQVDARLNTCRNNLKQIGIAIHNYYDTFQRMPPGWTAHSPDAGTGARFGWSSSILPFIDQYQLFDKLDFNKNMPGPNQLLQTEIAPYRCPADRMPAVNPVRGNYGTSNYSGNFGANPIYRPVPGRLSQYWPGQLPTAWNGLPAGGKDSRRNPRGQGIDQTSWNGLFTLNRCARFGDVLDGLSNTMMVSERCYLSGAGIWPGVGDNSMENDLITDASPLSPVNEGMRSFSSMHDGVFNLLICDGSVRVASTGIASSRTLDAPYQLLQKLAARNDGEVIEEF